MSNDEGGFTYRPAGGRRRVSMFIAVPVVAGCAALGTMAGVIAPIRPTSGPAGEMAAQAQSASGQTATTPQSAGDAAPRGGVTPAPQAAPASGELATPPGKIAAPPPPPPRPVPQPVRTISEDDPGSARPRSPEIETGSVDHRSRPADEAKAPVLRSKHESAREEPAGETSARAEGHARRMRAKRVRRVHVQQRPVAQPSSQAPAVAPASQNSYTSLVPAQ